MTPEEYLRKKLKEELEKEYFKSVQQLHEGLIKTTNTYSTKKLLGRWLKNPADIEITLDGTIIVDISDFKDHIISFEENFLRLINNLGYFISIFYYSKNNKMENLKYDKDICLRYLNDKEIKRILIVLEAKFDRELSHDEIPYKIYHATKMKYLNKIQQNGLIPKSKDKLSHHPERIYFGLNYDAAFDYYRQNKEKDELWTILEIDVKNIQHIRLFDDPNYKDYGVYSIMNIPPDKIKTINKDI